MPGDDDQEHREPAHGHHDPSGHIVKSFFTNWHEYRGSFGEKLGLTMRNRWRAYRPPFRGCCGHPGEPGC